MINITRWSPDTCGCVIEYSWDSNVPEDQRTHSPTKAVVICKDHENDTVLSTHFSKLIEENPRKNNIMDRLEKFTELVDSQIDGTVKLKEKLVSWEYNKNRVLEVTINGLSTQKKLIAQTWANNNLGDGKVVIL